MYDFDFLYWKVEGRKLIVKMILSFVFTVFINFIVALSNGC